MCAIPFAVNEFNTVEIFGIKAQNVTVSQNLGSRDAIYVQGDRFAQWTPVSYFVSRPEPIMLTLQAVQSPSYNPYLSDIIDRLSHCATPMFNLGKTVICSHCGFEAKPGLLTCHRCGSIMRTNVDNSKYTRAGTILVHKISTSWNALAEDGGYVTDIEMSLMLEDDSSFDFRNSWQTLSCDGEWICAYCHCVNYKGDVDCRFCSAGRLPFSNLKDMPSNCLYCGKPLRGATICEMCSSAKNGYAVWPAIYKM